MASKGRIFLLGDDIDTDQLAPGQFMKEGIDVLAAHCLETVWPGFAEQLVPGDFVIAGRNFGMGSSREQAAEALKYLGVQAVIAQSFGGIFYRNAINLGLPVLLAQNTDSIHNGDSASLALQEAQLLVFKAAQPALETVVPLQAVPPNIQQILKDGGLVAHLKKRFENEP